MWNNIKEAPADSIFGLSEAYKKDPNPHKVNLGVGVYKDDQGVTPVLASVKAAEKILLEKEKSKSYLPISGDPVYASCVQKLLFGENSKVLSDKRAATIHAPGGTGALRVGGDLLKKFKPQAKIWVSTPTWANHLGVFAASGFELDHYPYYTSSTKNLDFAALISCLEKIPEGDVVLFHACCHNPSGVDPNPDQWRQIVITAKEKGWLPFLDFAYQGFGEGIEEDRIAVELLAESGIDFFIASSFSKNFGLYNERTGALTIVSPTVEENRVAMSHLKKTVRVIYSNPPAHGGLTVATILTDDVLKKQWHDEIAGMRNRIKSMRVSLVEGLQKRKVPMDFSSITQQRGMFSFSGLSDDIVSWMKKEKGVYVVGGGRINVAGLTTGNIDYVCDAIAEAVESV